jgi:ribosomal protein S18 acetylase RimI-like enzyme
MTESAIRIAQPNDARRMAELHATRIRTGFLSSLGPRFLERLYRRVARSANAFAFVSEEDGRVVAFCASAENVRRFYIEFATRDGIVAGVVAAPRLARALPRVIETVRYPVKNEGSLPSAEILAVVTDEGLVTRGLARAVVQRSLDELEHRGCTTAKVVAGRDNTAALRLYERCGFAAQAEISVHNGVPSEVLVWAS